MLTLSGIHQNHSCASTYAPTINARCVRLNYVQVACGVDGVIVGGTTGEGQLMSWDEHIMLIAHTVNNFGSKLAVVGNTGSNATREAVHATEQGFAVGMHAALQINPYYGKTSEDGLMRHFESVLDLGPAILYNVPARTSQDMRPEFIKRLSGHENLLGVKECEGNERIKQYAAMGISTWSGNDDECHSSRYDAGATGVISVTSNVLPGLFHSLMCGGVNDQLNEELQPLISWIFQEPNPIGINTLMAMLGVCEPVFRLPYVPLRAEERERGMELLLRIGLHHCPGQGTLRRLYDDEFETISVY